MTISLSTYRTPTTPTFDSLFDALFDPFFGSVTIPRKKENITVSTKVTAEDDKYIISVAAPGLDKGDFSIALSESVLTIKTERAVEEFGISPFTRRWTLPEGMAANNISADYNQGILRVTVEKPEVTKPETVTIKVS